MSTRQPQNPNSCLTLTAKALATRLTPFHLPPPLLPLIPRPRPRQPDTPPFRPPTPANILMLCPIPIRLLDGLPQVGHHSPQVLVALNDGLLGFGSHARRRGTRTSGATATATAGGRRRRAAADGSDLGIRHEGGGGGEMEGRKLFRERGERGKGRGEGGTGRVSVVPHALPGGRRSSRTGRKAA